MSVSYRQKSTMHTHGVSANQCLSVQEPMQVVKSCFKKAVSLLYHGQKKFTCLNWRGGGIWCLRLPPPKKKQYRRRGYIKVQAAIFNLFTACMLFLIEADPMLLGHSKYSNTFSITILEYTRMQNQMHD